MQNALTDDPIDIKNALTLDNNEVTFSRELHNFNKNDLCVLREICRYKEPFKSIKIVSKLYIHEGGVNRVLKRLREKGFVENILKTHEWKFLGRETLETVLKTRVKRLIENIFNE